MDAYVDSAAQVKQDTALATPSAGTNDLVLVSTTTEDLCTEKWTLSTNRIKCVHLTYKFKRPMTPATFDTVQKNCDVKFTYRKFEVTAKWDFNAQSTDPGMTTFYSQKAIVDFERFLLPAEAAYDGASLLGLTLSGLGLALWTLVF